MLATSPALTLQASRHRRRGSIEFAAVSAERPTLSRNDRPKALFWLLIAIILVYTLFPASDGRSSLTPSNDPTLRLTCGI